MQPSTATSPGPTTPTTGRPASAANAPTEPGGVPVVLGSDWPVAQFDRRRVLAAARLCRPPGEPDVPPVRPRQGLTPLMALEGYTRLAAAAADRTGTITAGAAADLTAFALAPLRADPDELADAPIALTVVAGAVVHRTCPTRFAREALALLRLSPESVR
ncbi:amidohydrolase family protein [Amycolatopsis sp. EV170708-02-1]|uniref:amidohydrolase family protein n=1 Tax=Amycolatopsis sp. EV170708-02-1 TaxID=2919322 RepID=UPI001F0BC842|nr:amidohydrolase family protein [Amycolatopsis sp. EV170708-02-1]UMP06839.1 amidohydrolase family protein [Amycolatopsis sp. EV170708-02-1]